MCCISQVTRSEGNDSDAENKSDDRQHVSHMQGGRRVTTKPAELNGITRKKAILMLKKPPPGLTNVGSEIEYGSGLTRNRGGCCVRL
jgi:hypothetical protein